jgi:Transposase domain (DUF772)
MNALPQTGTSALLEKLSPYLDDSFVNELLPRQPHAGRRRAFSSAQMLRVLLLALLTPAHHFNLLIRLLPENRGWRRFARLSNQRKLPDAKMLHQFRDRIDLIHLRHLNNHLVRGLLEQMEADRKTVAIIDATDLPASANSFKKTRAVLPGLRPWGHGPSKVV